MEQSPSWEANRFLCCSLYIILLYITYLLTYIPTYLYIPCSRVLPEKLTGSQLVKKFPAFYETRSFITTFTSARHLSLSWANSIQSIPQHPISWRSTSILSSHLRLGLPCGLFPSGFPTNTLYTFLLFVASGSLSPRQGVSSGCGWRNGLRYGG